METTSLNIEPRLIIKHRTLEETYVFSDGTSFTKTGGTYAAGDVTWDAAFTSWKVLQMEAPWFYTCMKHVFFFEILAPFEITLHLARNPLNLSFFKCLLEGFFSNRLSTSEYLVHFIPASLFVCRTTSQRTMRPTGNCRTVLGQIQMESRTKFKFEKLCKKKLFIETNKF